MFVLERRETQAALRDQDEANSVIAGLEGAGFKPFLRQTLDSAYRAAGLLRPTTDMDLFVTERARYMRHSANPTPVGDLFFLEQQVFVLQPLQTKLRVWSIRPHTAESRLDEFCEATTKAATGRLDGRRLRGMTFAWQAMEAKIEGRAPLDPAPRGIEKLKSKKPEYSEQEARLAESLVEKDARTVLLQLAQARGKARSADTKSDADAKIIANLHDSHLILREYLVLCRQDSHTICSLRDRSQLGGESGLDLRCSICGRPFRDENVQEIFALSDSATKLLDGSVWLSIWVTELLKRAGVPGTSILWNATAGEDEIDIVADLYGSRVFFELKDRDFGLGDAYPFAFRIQRYGGRHGVVVSTGNVADEVKALFRERTPGVASAPIDVVEGAHAISRNLPELIDSLSRSPALRVAAELGESMGVNLLPLVSAWMKRVSSPARASE